mgnify:FL=1
MASRKDVAALAKVSQASVSYYINKSGYVSAEAAERIQKAIDTLGYRPNQIARSLRCNKSKRFVFLCNEIRNPFFSQMVHQATQEAIKKGYVILFSTVVDDSAYIEKIFGYQISGVFASNNRLDEKPINNLASQGVPVVILRDIEWKQLNPNITLIKVNYQRILKTIINHLEENGFRRYFYFSSSRNPSSADEKTLKFLEATEGKTQTVFYQISDPQRGFEQVINIKKEIRVDDAFICANDAVAFGVRKALDTLEYFVPNDVAVVGFDNTINSKYTIPGITTVDIEADKIGAIAISLLIKKMQGVKVDDYIIEPKLIIRNSSNRV